LSFLFEVVERKGIPGDRFLQTLHQLGTEAIGMKNIGIVDIQIDDTTGDLVLTNLQREDFLIGEGELVQHEDIPIGFLKAGSLVECEDRLELNSLRVRGFGLFLVGELDTDLIDVVLDLRGVIEGEVNEEVVIDAVDIVDDSTDAIGTGMEVEELPPCAIDSPGITSHRTLGHADLWIGVVLHVLLLDIVKGIGLIGSGSIDDIVLGEVALTNDGDGAEELVGDHPVGRLDPDDIVGTLVTDDVLGGDVNKLDVLRHDDMRGDILVDIDGMAVDGQAVDRR